MVTAPPKLKAPAPDKFWLLVLKVATLVVNVPEALLFVIPPLKTKLPAVITDEELNVPSIVTAPINVLMPLSLFNVNERVEATLVVPVTVNATLPIIPLPSGMVRLPNMFTMPLAAPLIVPPERFTACKLVVPVVLLSANVPAIVELPLTVKFVAATSIEALLFILKSLFTTIVPPEVLIPLPDKVKFL